MLLSISPFMAVSICLIYWGAPMLGAYIFTIVISSSWIYPLIIMECPFSSLVTGFILKFIFYDINIATPAFFWFPCLWNTFFHPLPFSLYVSLELKWFSCRQHIYGFCFCMGTVGVATKFVRLANTFFVKMNNVSFIFTWNWTSFLADPIYFL